MQIVKELIFPIPGSPPNNVIDPGTIPPPNTIIALCHYILFFFHLHNQYMIIN